MPPAVVTDGAFTEGGEAGEEALAQSDVKSLLHSWPLRSLLQVEPCSATNILTTGCGSIEFHLIRLTYPQIPPPGPGGDY